MEMGCVRYLWAGQEEGAFASQAIESVMFARNDKLRCFRHRLFLPPHGCASMAGRSTQCAAMGTKTCWPTDRITATS